MTVTANETGICIELHGKEQFWALRAKVSVPTDTIKDVRFEPVFQDWRKWEVRMPGTHAPRLLLAGSYWTEEGWDFLYIKRPTGFINPRVENVLVVETTENRYTRVIVSLDEKTAKGIIRWWNQIQSTEQSSKGRGQNKNSLKTTLKAKKIKKHSK